VSYNFEWDPTKARRNRRKHGVSFEDAAELFLDPLAISVLDWKHSDTEERWVTIGRDSRGRVLVLIHTFQERPVKEWNVRIISARKATRREVKQYEGLRS
jgi:uncharacterized protein